MVIVDEESGVERARSGAFSFADDGCSVYVERVLTAHGLGHADVVRAPANSVVAVSVEAVRAIGLDAHAGPFPPVDEPHPRDAAHALVTPPGDWSRRRVERARKSLAREAVFVLVGKAG